MGAVAWLTTSTAGEHLLLPASTNARTHTQKPDHRPQRHSGGVFCWASRQALAQATFPKQPKG